jgi:elongation factor 1-beta
VLTPYPRYSPSQADVTVYKALKSAPNSTQHPNTARWYKQIASHQNEFESLPGDKSTDISKYGPDTVPTTVNPAAAPAEEDDDEVDLFGSDDEEEDAAKAALTAKRLEEYNKKKAAKPKTSMLFALSGRNGIC